MDAFGFGDGSCLRDDFENPQLNIFYSHQYMNNESTPQIIGDFNETVHNLQKTDVLAGTVTGMVYRGTTAVQTFTVDMQGNVKFDALGSPDVRVVRGGFDGRKGKLSFLWNKEPGSCHLVVCYEYNMLPVDCPSKKVAQPTTFVTPTFNKFFNSQELAEIANKAGTVCCWDFNTALGDTIKEKYESLYVKCYEITNVLLKKGAVGYFWITTSPEVGSIFETACAGFNPLSSEDFESKMIGGVLPLGLPVIDYKGSINSRWRLYTDTMMPNNMILIGCNDTVEHSSHYGRMVISNFIF